jgi:two-component system chemotaxis response regulator CheB
MPTAAIATGCVDLVLPPRVLGPALVAMTLAPGAADWFNAPPRPWALLADA